MPLPAEIVRELGYNAFTPYTGILLFLSFIHTKAYLFISVLLVCKFDWKFGYWYFMTGFPSVKSVALKVSTIQTPNTCFEV